MSEIRIIHQQTLQTPEQSAVRSQLSDQFVENLRTGQVLTARLVSMEGKYWLIVEDFKLAIPEEKVQQWQLREDQAIKLKVKSLSEPVELQIIKKPEVSQATKTINDPLQKQPTLLQTMTDQATKAKTDNLPENKAAPQQPITKDGAEAQTKIKHNAEKLILEVRNYFNKNILTTDNQGKSTSTDNQITKSGSQQTPDAGRSTASTEQPATAKITQRSLLSAGSMGTAALLSSSTEKATPENRTNQANPDSVAKSIPKSDSGQPTASAPKDGENKQLNSPANTDLTNLLKSNKTTVENKVTAQTPLQQGTRSSSENQQLKIAVPTDSGATGKPDVAVNIKSPQAAAVLPANVRPAVDPATSSAAKVEKINFEIMASLPDKERFPLLSEKLIAAYQRHMNQRQPLTNSFNQLLTQLQRLNDWSTKYKSLRHSPNGEQSAKMATDLRQSLKDLFRYISQKDTLTSGKAVEKALRQSGTFLESRTAQQENAQQKQLKVSPELTLHKDLKANLNRVMATALYNLAKSSASQSQSASQAAQTTATATATAKDALLSTATRTAQETPALLKNNLLDNIKMQLRKYTAAQTAAGNLKELNIITKEVLKAVQSALSQSQLGQLTNLRPDTSAQQWFFELPVMNNNQLDVFSLYIKEHKVDEEHEKKSSEWSLVLQFNLGNLGRIRAMLKWQESQIKIRFLAEQSSTVALVDQELAQLKNKIAFEGLSFDELTVEQAQLDDLKIQFSESAINDR